MLLQAQALPVSQITILVIIILVLLTLTGIIAGAETAFFSLKPKDMVLLKTKEGTAPRRALALVEQPKILLATVLVSTTLLNIALIISTSMLVKLITPDGMSSRAIFIAQVLVVTFVLVLFGAVLPKVYAVQHTIRTVLFSTPVLQVATELLRPLSRTLVSSTAYIEEKLSTRPADELSTEEFERSIELSVGHTATREQVAIFRGILKFGTITARQIMRTRLDVVGIPETATFAQVQKLVVDAGFSRMPVYRGTLDTVVGTLHTKDLLPHLDAGADFDWHTLLRPALFVHQSKPIEDLRREFAERRLHMAIVVDEYGGTSGVVTLEDIMEEIIGEIRDEFDEEDLSYRKIDDANFLFDGKTLINDACRAMGLQPDAFEAVRGESDSVGGLVLEIAGRFPALNESVSWEGYDFTVLELDRMRIRMVKITLPARGEGEEG